LIVLGNVGLAQPAQVVVTNTADSGIGSLYQATQDANSGVCASPCTITFAIAGSLPPAGYFTIQPTPSFLLVVATSDVTIDGTTEAAFLGMTSSTPLIVIDGSLASSGPDGIRVAGTGSTVSNVVIRGLGIQNFANGGGINLDGSVYSISGVRIVGNFIGLTPAGTAAPNFVGIVYTNVSGSDIGMNPSAPDPADRNVISGNATAGIMADGWACGVYGNYVGTDPAGTGAVPNGFGMMFTSGYWVTVGSATAPNVVAYNTLDAIVVRNSAAVTITRNSIHDNGFGINLYGPTPDGVTPNDVGDLDNGGNSLQNFPVLTGKSFDGSNTTINGSLSSHAEAGYTYRIEFYANAQPSASGYGEGALYIGETQVSPDATGYATFTATLPGDFTANFITATATVIGVPGGMVGWTAVTSEFSQIFEADIALTASDSPDPVVAGSTITYDIAITNNGPADANGFGFSIFFDPATSNAQLSYIGWQPAWACMTEPATMPPSPQYFTCSTLDLIPPGTTVTVQASAVAPASSGIVTATVNAGATNETNPANNPPTPLQTTVLTIADLGVSVIDTPDPVTAGGAITYQITVTNAGPSAAESVVLYLSFDPTGAAMTPPLGWQCIEAVPDPPPGFVGVWAPPSMFNCVPEASLAPGTYTLQGQVTPFATSGTYTMTARIQSSNVDPDGTNNGPIAVLTTIGLNADLSLAQSGAPPVAGSMFTYTLTVTNGGPSSVTGVRLLDTLVMVSAASPRLASTRRNGRPVSPSLAGETWSCSATPGSTCGASSGAGDVDVLLDLTAGGSASVVVSAPIPSTATGSITQSTSLILPPGVTDPTPADNTSTISLPVTLSSDLSISMSCSELTPRAGDPVTYTILVSNSGPSAVTGARLSDLLPAALTAAQWTCTPSLGAVCGAPSGIGNIDVLLDLSVGAQVVVRLDATISQTAAGTLTNTASMTPPGGTGDPDTTNNSAFDSIIVAACPTGPQPLAPLGTTLDNPSTVTFSWSDVGASSYELFVSTDGGVFAPVGISTTTSLAVSVASGAISWYVDAVTGNCQVAGPRGSFTVRVCLAPERPVPYLVGEVNSDERFTFSWTTPDADVTFEFRDSPTPAFGDTAWIPTTSGKVTFTYTNGNVVPVDYWFQVRAVRQCPQGPLYSDPAPAVRVVIRPAGAGSDSANVEHGQGRLVNQLLRICANDQGHIVPCNEPHATGTAIGSHDVPFTITTDRSWMTVTPSTTMIPPGGTNVIVTSNPQGLPTGTNTGSIVVAQSGGSTSNVPFSVNIVTPVSPQPKTPPRDALIIPAVAHADGIGSLWQSDIRVTNIATHAITYDLTFTPSGVDGSIVGKKTQITIESGETKALDDVVKQWYGLGSLGDGTNGVLEIRPAESGRQLAATSVELFSTIASSRTYNSTPDGTYGQWIPAIPFAEFVGRDAGDGSSVLSMQHIAQSSRFRTNLGLVEGAGAEARVLVSVFDPSGGKSTEFTIDLKAMEHQQLNSFLATRDIVLENGRIEAKVVDGQGRITAYASVIDALTNDPLFVPGVNASSIAAARYVVPGLADLDTGVNCWRSDLRIFNPSQTGVDTTIVFYAQNDPTITRTTQLAIPPRQIRVLDNALQTLFGLTGIGGAVHVIPDTTYSLVITGRTYDQQESGTYGQFIPAVTEAEAVGVSDRALEILQIEQSDRYRTNLGLVEVAGKDATVEVTAIVPGATVAPKMRVELQGNGFTQLLNVLQQMNLATVYNVRLSVKVVAGEGRVSAYGSVIDRRTQDPTYVKAQ
jgi:uncharacterized repeat protein (TIGR01451 family)